MRRDLPCSRKIFCNGRFSRCGNTAMMGAPARIHRLENIGIPPMHEQVVCRLAG
jgi:hypothetical protein